MLVAFMFVVLLIIFAFAIASSFNYGVQANRNSMGCNSTANFTSMDYGHKVTCTITDLYSPFYIALILGIAGTIIAIKLNG